jgi:hypothetical protein
LGITQTIKGRALMKSYLLLTVFLAFSTSSMATSDPLIGEFLSENRENFGSDDPGEYKLVVSKLNEKYQVSLFHKGINKGSIEAFTCDIKQEDYLNNRAPGVAKVICKMDRTQQIWPLLSYAENGISVLGREYKTKYYARIGWAVRGFKKLQ